MTKTKNEIAIVAREINATFKTSETVAVDPEYCEVCFYVDVSEYDTMKKNISTGTIDLKYDRCDNDTYMLHFKYTLKIQQ